MASKEAHDWWASVRKANVIEMPEIYGTCFDAGREPLLAENRKLTEERDGYLKQLQDDPLAEENRKLREALEWALKQCLLGPESLSMAAYREARKLLTEGHPTPAPGSGEPKLKADAPDMDFI